MGQREPTQMQKLVKGLGPLDFLGPYDPAINEYPMWHGTSHASAAGSICHSGFDIAYAGTRATAWGHGFYFADSAGVSLAYCQSERVSAKHTFQVMFLCRVIAGNVKSLSAAPTNEQKEQLTAEC